MLNEYKWIFFNYYVKHLHSCHCHPGGEGHPDSGGQGDGEDSGLR